MQYYFSSKTIYIIQLKFIVWQRPSKFYDQVLFIVRNWERVYKTTLDMTLVTIKESIWIYDIFNTQRFTTTIINFTKRSTNWHGTCCNVVQTCLIAINKMAC